MLATRSDERDAYIRLNEGLRDGSVRVCGAHGARGAGEADVLVVAQAGSMASSGVMLLVKVAERGLFTRAERITLNGISGFIGPAPNERLGVVDVLVTGAMASETDPAYTGAHLFDDLLHDREIRLECLSQEHTRHSATTRLSIMDFARTTVYDMAVDPELARLGEDSLFAGATVMLDGGEGIILGSGSLCGARRPSLSCAADCFGMDRDLLLPARDGRPARHVLAMAFPLWRDGGAEALLERAAAMAAQRPEEERAILETCETRMARALTEGALTCVDPGPKPYRTILSTDDV